MLKNILDKIKKENAVAEKTVKKAINKVEHIKSAETAGKQGSKNTAKAAGRQDPKDTAKAVSKKVSKKVSKATEKAVNTVAAKTVNKNALEAPYSPCIQSITDKGIMVYWKKPQGVSGYEIYRSYEKGKLGELAMVIDNPILGVWSDDEFDHDYRTIYYQVRCYKDQKDGSKTFSDFTEEFQADYREELILERDVTIIHSNTSRLLRAFYGWGELTDAVWTSSDESVAEIDEEGNVIGISKGECYVTCESPSLNMSATSKVIIDRSAPEPLMPIDSRYQFNESTQMYDKKEISADNEATIMMVGDMMCGLGQIQKQYNEEEGWNFNDSFDYVKEITKDSDFTIGNLETLLDPSWPYMSDEWFINNISNCNAPSRYLDAIKYGGFDGVIMSNNHSCDGGVLSLKSTIDQVEHYQLLHTGAYRNKREKHYFIANINGIKVGYVAYMSLVTGYNGKDRHWSEKEKDTLLSNFSPEKAAKDVADCRKAGAEYIIAYMHWGQKNYKEPTVEQEEEALQMANAGADYIVGSNPHVLERYDVIKADDGREVPCFYSIGNFHARMNQITGNRDSVVVRIKLKKEDGNVRLAENTYIPCFTYSNLGDCYLPPVSLILNQHQGIVRKGRKTKYERIMRAIGPKVNVYKM